MPMIRMKKKIRIREEDGFYLVVNLTTEDMLNGYPAFFKTNGVGKSIFDLLSEPIQRESIAIELFTRFPNVGKEMLCVQVEQFLATLQRYALIEEVTGS